MKITLLGTNGWFDTPTGSTPCVLLQTNDFDIIFDAGYGFTKVDRLVDGRHPVYLLLSHFHLDHLVGLHTLPKSNFYHGLTILGQPGTVQALNGLLGRPYSMPLDSHRFPVHVIEINDSSPNLPFKLTALPLIHSGPCLGYRVEIGGTVVTYCTDTGYCNNAVTLAREADLFLTECSLAPGVEAHPGWPHLSPGEAAQMAQEAAARRLVLIHFDPTQYPTLADRDAAEVEARHIFPESYAGRDGMEISLA
jgi:ribonuclease BN (tRNA processing enzyme)